MYPVDGWRAPSSRHSARRRRFPAARRERSISPSSARTGADNPSISVRVTEQIEACGEYDNNEAWH